ncbi:MAG: flagellin [Pseudomonadota bacterium]
MTALNLGDLSQSFSLRQRNTSLKMEMDRLTTELASGQVAEVRQVLAGNYGYLTEIERKLDLLGNYNVATTEAGYFTEAIQNSLGRVEELSTTLSASLLTAGTSAIGVSGSDTVAEARNTLEAMIGAFNTDVAGRYLFSGTATDQRPLLDADDLLADLRTAISGATTPDAMIADAKAWFDAPTGFAAVIYQGATDALAPFALSQTENVTLDIRATDPKIYDVLRLTALAALADDPVFGLDIAGQSELFGKTGQQMLGAKDDIIALRAEVGFVEARIDQINTRNAAEITSLEYARTALLEADPYETATRLEDVQFQLQSLYAVTVRSSQLSLVNFL